jgi:ATP-dependent Clp protease, protease subunit
MLLKLNQDNFNDKHPNQSFYMLFDDVSSVSAKEAVQWIMEANFANEDKPEVLNLVINSPGGDLNAAFAIIDVMRGSKIPVRTIGLGQIASAGLMIFIAGAKGHRVLTENTSIMSHQYTWGSMGKHHELIAAVREFDLTSLRMVDHYKRCTGLKEEKIKKYLLPPQDVYLSAKEAIELGLADTISKLN